MRLQRVKRLSRPKLRHKRREKRPEPVRGDFIANLEDPAVAEVFARIGRNPRDYKLAQRVVALQKQFPQGTIPELITYDYLQQKNIPFTYQAWISGGRSRAGGVIPDFVLQYGGTGMAWLVQGQYWHNRPEVAASDVADKLALVGHYFEHVFIEKALELWERQIYFNRPAVFEMALVGIEIGQ